METVQLGNRVYTKAECLRIFAMPIKKNGGLIKLPHQLIAAKLNVAKGSNDSCISAAIAQADALIGDRTVPPIGPGGLANKKVSKLHSLLDSYNNGNLCAPHCGD